MSAVDTPLRTRLGSLIASIHGRLTASQFQTLAEAASALEASEAKIAALTAERDALREERKDRERQIRVSEYRRAVEWLHGRAKAMNDPHARAVLDLAGDELGRYRAQALRQEGKP